MDLFKSKNDKPVQPVHHVCLAQLNGHFKAVITENMFRFLWKQFSDDTIFPSFSYSEPLTSSATWLTLSFQNKIIKFLANKVLGLIKQELHEAKYFTSVADETKDVSKHEQLSFAFRYVYKCKTVERFTGYCMATELNAGALTDYITNKMTELELKNEHLVSQCFDGASVMSGCNAGVQKLVKKNVHKLFTFTAVLID